jgi:hypothetical protein
MAGIAGTVTGVSTVDYKVLLYADVRGTWYVQPFTNRPDTTIAPNGQWQSETHLGEQYAAILVKKASTAAQPITRELPKIGGDVVALTVVRGRNVELAPDPPVLKPATSTLGPQIFSLSPAKIAQNINQVITVSGNNFMTGFFMRLGSPDGGSTYLKPDQIHSATSSSFSFEAVLAPGTWMIHVVNPDGTLSNGFSLTVTR